jgi:hypothetical protein
MSEKHHEEKENIINSDNLDFSNDKNNTVSDNTNTVSEIKTNTNNSEKNVKEKESVVEVVTSKHDNINNEKSNTKIEEKSITTNSNTNSVSVNNNSKKDPKFMTLQEQVDFYKDQFTKTKKLFIHYEKENKNNELKLAKLNERIIQYEPQSGEIIKILYKFSHSNSTFYYLESQKSSYFIREDLIKEMFPNAYSDNDIPEYSYEKEIKKQEETIQQIIMQYDERIIRLKNEIEAYEKSFLANKDLKNNSCKLIESIRLFYDESIKQLIRNSNDVYLLLKSSLDIEYTDDLMQVEVFSNMSKHIEDLKQSDIVESIKTIVNIHNNNYTEILGNNNEVFNGKWLNELKLFNSNLLKLFSENLNSLIKTNTELIDQKVKWQNTLDQLIVNNNLELSSSK